MEDKAQVNVDAYRTSDAVEKYSSYHLYRSERYLFSKYYLAGDTILDLACGAGRTTLRLHELGFRVKGVDLSDVLIHLAQRRFPYLNFEIGSYCDLKEKEGSYAHLLISHNGLDYAYPEAQRVQALNECFRVLKPGGTLIFSSHNIKSLYASPLYFREYKRAIWKTLKTGCALREKAYLFDLGMWTFYGSPDYVVRQATAHGLVLIEIVGFKLVHNRLLNKYGSPYIHYVFTKN